MPRILKFFLKLLLLITAGFIFYFSYPSLSENLAPICYTSGAGSIESKKLQSFGQEAKSFCKKNRFNTSTCFLIDMNLPSGRDRFFVYDMQKDSVLNAGLVAHGSCNYTFLEAVKFSNTPGCGCSASGKYKVGGKYTGRFGLAYKLYGLEKTNSNAFTRNIVLHSYYLVPDKETDPVPICNSLGCAMVSGSYLKLLSQKIDMSTKPILLWIFN